MATPISRPTNSFKPNRTDVLWHTNHELVLKEVALLMGLPEVSTKTKNWFRYRTAGAKAAMEKMTSEERATLDADIERLTKEGYNPKHQRNNASRFAVKQIRLNAESNYLEMGISSIVFATYRLPDGRLMVDMHERIAELMGYRTSPFKQLHGTLVKDMKNALMNYVKVLETTAISGDVPFSDSGVRLPPGTGMDKGKLKFNFETTGLGYPILPNPIPCLGWGKTDWEIFLKSYLSAHYYLATAKKTEHVPYKQINLDQSAYIDPKYLPDDMALRDPRNLIKEKTVSFFNHLIERQKSHGPEETFRFKGIKTVNGVGLAKYPETQLNEVNAVEAQADAVDPPPPSKKKGKAKNTTARKTKAKAKAKGKETMPVEDETVADGTTAMNTNPSIDTVGIEPGPSVPRPRPRSTWRPREERLRADNIPTPQPSPPSSAHQELPLPMEVDGEEVVVPAVGSSRRTQKSRPSGGTPTALTARRSNRLAVPLPTPSVSPGPSQEPVTRSRSKNT
ncbi:hypothetical protein GALMADRAFT_216469 [Galerina marginata CBS 339.88]|uniref:Uncharacterized protein n=1 Tax=Galerina marginata (strain CBS 339.88) TaxID=685588 RepID=A0A067S957_GALM3|nr:hypothetical protein GALMADRAFT_216469 [Galerina marginata CBS 339.88]